MEPPEQQACRCSPHMHLQGAYSVPVQRWPQQEAEGCVYGMLQPGAGLAWSFRPITHGNLQTSLRAEEAVQCGGILSGAVPSALPRRCYKRFARTYLPYWLALLAKLGVSLSF